MNHTVDGSYFEIKMVQTELDLTNNSVTKIDFNFMPCSNYFKVSDGFPYS